MPRSINAPALAELAKKLGTKPINIIAIDWNGTVIEYADKNVDNIKGNIASISNLDEVIKVENGGTAVSVSITLIDTDNSIKTLFDNYDLNNRPCQIYQYFEGLALDERFLLFNGAIAGPITWKEGERTVSFDVISSIFSDEVGFSPEEGQLPNIRNEFTGKTWPLCFGTPVHVPAVKASDKITGTTATVMGLRDPVAAYKISLLVSEIASMEMTYKYLANLMARASLYARNPYVLSNEYAGLILEEDPLKQSREDDLEIIKQFDKTIQQLKDKLPGAITWDQYNSTLTDINEQIAIRDAAAADVYEVTARLAEIDFLKKIIKVDTDNIEYIGKYMDDIKKLITDLLTQYFKALDVLFKMIDNFAYQVSLEKSTIVILNGENFPQNQDVEILINGVCFNGSFSGNIFTVKALMPHYRNVEIADRQNSRPDLFWIKQDTNIIRGEYALLQNREIIKISNQIGTTCQFDLVEKQEANTPNTTKPEIPKDTQLAPGTVATLSATYEHTRKERLNILKEAVSQATSDQLKDLQESITKIIKDIGNAPNFDAQIDAINAILINANLYEQVVDAIQIPLNIEQKAFEAISKEEFDILLKLQNSYKAALRRNATPITPTFPTPDSKYVIIGAQVLHIVETSAIILPYWLNVLTPANLAKLPTSGPWIAEVGSNVVLKEGFLQKWICNILPSTIHSVYAFRSLDGIKKFVPVPSRFYFKTEDEDLGGIHATSVTLYRPLSDYEQGWEDQIYVTLTSTQGPNTVDEIRYIIETYTNLAVDNTSFNDVRTKIANYPSSFALLEKKDAIKMIEEMAWQARCRVYISDGVVYIQYLSEDPTASETITETDIEQSTLEVYTSSVEDLVTKFVAEWLPSYEHQDKYKVILRRNYRRYKKSEKTYDFYIYNIEELVIKSATFWLIRLGNMWKKIRFKTFLTKLKIVTGDAITVNLSNNYIANTSFKALVEKADYDSASNSIVVEAWTPILVGTMTPNIFAWPAGISVDVVYPTIEDILSGNAGNPIGTFVPTGESFSGGSRPNIPEFRPKDYGSIKPSDHGDQMPGILGPYLGEIDYSSVRLPPSPLLENRTKTLGNYQPVPKIPGDGIPDRTQTKTSQFKVKPGTAGSTTLYGNVIDVIPPEAGQNEFTNQYLVRGRSGEIYTVSQQSITTKAAFPPGMAVQFHYDPFLNEYVMQMPTWIKGSPVTRESQHTPEE